MLEIYTQQPDSSFTKFKTLNNIYPIYFENYSLDYEIENEDLSKLKDRYQGFNPLEELKVEHNKIVLKILSDATTSFILTYTYSSKKANWFLDKFELYDHNSERVIEDSTRLIGSGIDSFDYFDYLEERF